MDPKLAELYGTGSVDEADLEKLAAAELAESLAAEQGVDLSGMDPEEIEALAQEVLSGGEGGEQEKLAEADYLGRVMAHSFAQESREIEKTAGPAWEDTKKHVGRAWGRYSELMKGGKRAGPHTTRHGGTINRNPGNILGAHFRGTQKGEAWKSTGTRAGTAGAAAAAGYGAYRAGKKMFGKKKRSSVTPALDVLAEARAQELLESQGGESFDSLAEAVDQRALEMLAEAGYDVE